MAQIWCSCDVTNMSPKWLSIQSLQAGKEKQYKQE